MRARFAPSPTGLFHVGSARSVLFNWAFARHEGGTLVLRIEDTDAARNRPEWIDGIISAMAWLGIGAQQYEGPYFQSENLPRHTEAAAAAVPAGPGVLLRLHQGRGGRQDRRLSTGATTASAGTAAWSRVRAGRCGSGHRTRARR